MGFYLDIGTSLPIVNVKLIKITLLIIFLGVEITRLILFLYQFEVQTLTKSRKFIINVCLKCINFNCEAIG